VLDVMMPEMNGVEFLQVLRSYLGWGSIPVILLTAYPEGPHIDRARELGVRCPFTKAGYHMADLVGCARQLLADPNASCAG
jgi:CheY-like chemotaxis protein